MDQETYDKSRRYQLDKTNFGLVHGVFNQIETAVSYVEVFLQYNLNFGADYNQLIVMCSLLFLLF